MNAGPLFFRIARCLLPAARYAHASCCKLPRVRRPRARNLLGGWPVIDARCGDGKAAVCHKPGQGNAGAVCVAPGAVQAFIRQGETLGSCS